MDSKEGFNGFKLAPGDVAILTFNQPRANVLSSPVLEDLVRAVSMLRAGGARALVITGEGKTFVAGADIKEMSGFTPDDAAAYARLFHQAMNAIAGFPGPVIAAVNGFALGGGCELVLACDMVIAAEGAVFAQPEVNLGIIPGAGGTQRLPERVGALRAKELIFTGRRVPAAEALAIGLVNKVVAGERLMEEALALARLLASKPARCIEAAKALIDAGSMEKEITAFSRLFSFDDRKRLMQDFIKKKR